MLNFILKFYLFKNMNLFTADVGQGKVHVYDSGNDIFHPKLPEQDLINLNIPKLKSGDTLVVECAHLRESHRMTMAQPYDWKQLNDLKQNAEEKGITILLFPQKSTPKARKLAGISEDDKSDETDTRAIANFLLKDKCILSSLKKFNPKKLKDFQFENDFVFDYIQQSNEDINPAKTRGYGFNSHDDYEDETSKWIKKYQNVLISELHDEELISAIGVELRGGKYKVVNPNRIYTLVHSILRPNGSLRFRPDRVNLEIDDKKKVPHWKFIKAHYLGCKPYHMKQGVAASNYKHWMRRAVSEFEFPGKKNALTSDFQVGMTFEQLDELKEARTKVDKMTQKIWNVLRKMIVKKGLR